MNQESQLHRHRRRTIIREFCLNTSTHGLPGIARAERKLNRIFWSISFLCFLGIMIFFLVGAIIAYFQYATNMDLRYIDDTQQYFPAISFCNLSPLRYDLFIKPFLNYTNTLNITNTNDTTTFLPVQSDSIWDFLIDIINQNESLSAFGFSLSSILQGCSFNSQPCVAEDFISFVSPFYGQCYTFNAKLKNSKSDNVRQTNQYGEFGDFNLGLYIHRHQYIPFMGDMGDASGAIVIIHDNTQLPMIETVGIELVPGKRHRLNYRKKKSDLLPSPYSTCINQPSPTMIDMFENYDGADYGYSRMVCAGLCRQLYYYEKCSCINPKYWNYRSITLPGTNRTIRAPLCTTTDTCYDSAVQAVIKTPSILDQYCSDCSEECSLTTFIVQASSSEGRFDRIMDNIKKFVENSSVELPINWTTTWSEEIKQNYLVVNVITETTVVETNTQSAKISAIGVLSNLGGQAGLWLGLSFLSLMEFIEMIFQLLRYQVYLMIR